MNYFVIIARILLGFVFVAVGLNVWLHFVPTPEFQGVAGQFLGAIFMSHFCVVVFLVQVVGGLLGSRRDSCRWDCGFSGQSSSTF